MAETEAYDRLRFTMVDGETFEQQVPAGQGAVELSNVGEDGDWLAIGESTRIRVDKIVSVRLFLHEGDRPLVEIL